MNQTSFGLVLSGGAAYGLANAGVLSVFKEHGVRPDVIAGSSMGAIIAALYAVGHDAATICKLAESLSRFSLVSLSRTPFRGGLHGGLLRQKLGEHVGHLLGNRCIGDTLIPFVCVAGRVKKPILWSRALASGFIGNVLNSIEPVILPDETPLLDALAATSALPIIFSPIDINGEKYVDLCSFGAVPARSLRQRYTVDTLIATNTTPSFRTLQRLRIPGITDFIEGAQKSLSESLAVCDLVITPALTGTLYDFQKGAAFVQQGKRATEDAWPAIETLLART